MKDHPRVSVEDARADRSPPVRGLYAHRLPCTAQIMRNLLRGAQGIIESVPESGTSDLSPRAAQAAEAVAVLGAALG
ncbi:hypothetical protein [Streptomyces sp. NBC_00212]|uniref:hypothetical protein n=1 Tax=Streptomyces sp. NBC_00212 TaxID=2975684 RepID=UPI003255CCA0